MTTMDGAALHNGAMMSEDGPWGGRGTDGGDAKPEGPRNPWDLPPTGGKPKTVRGKPAVDDLVARMKALRGGGGGSGGFGGGGLPAMPGPRLARWSLQKVRQMG